MENFKSLNESTPREILSSFEALIRKMLDGEISVGQLHGFVAAKPNERQKLFPEEYLPPKLSRVLMEKQVVSPDSGGTCNLEQSLSGKFVFGSGFGEFNLSGDIYIPKIEPVVPIAFDVTESISGEEFFSSKYFMSKYDEPSIRPIWELLLIAHSLIYGAHQKSNPFLDDEKPNIIGFASGAKGTKALLLYKVAADNKWWFTLYKLELTYQVGARFFIFLKQEYVD